MKVKLPLKNKYAFSIIYKITIALFVFLNISTINAQSTLVAELGSPVVYDGWKSIGSTSVNPADLTAVFLTSAIQNQAGAIYYNQPYTLVNECASFRVKFQYLMTGGAAFSENGITSTGDGIAFWFLENPTEVLAAGSNLGMPNTVATGTNRGLKVALDIYDNDSKGNNPAVMAFWGGNFQEGDARVISNPLPTLRSNLYQDAEIIFQKGVLTVSIAGVPVINNVTLTSFDNAKAITQGYFGFSASTGLATDIQSIKNVQVFLDVIPVKNVASLSGCVDDTGITGVFDLKSVDNDIATSGQFKYYKTYLGATSADPTERILTPKTHTGSDGDIVYVRVENTDGCYSIATIKLSLIKLKAIAAAPPLSSCGGKEITLDGSASTGQNLTYLWTTKNGKIISGANQPLVKVIDAGTYVLNVFSGICQNSVEVIIDKKIISPIIEVAPVTDKVSCINKQVTIDASKTQSGPTITYMWTTLNGNIVSGADTRTPKVDKAGTYVLTAQDSNQSCINSVTVVVEESVDVPTAIVVQKQELKTCGLINIDLDGSGSSSGANISYSWSASPGGVIVSGQNTNAIKVSAEGIYTLRVTNTASTCFVDFPYNLQADIVKPVVSIVQPEVLSCLKSSILLDGTASERGVDIQYNWTASLGGVLPLVTNANTLTVNKSGRYTLTVTNQITKCTSEFSVDVQNDPTAINVVVPNSVLLSCSNDPTILDGSQSSSNANLTYKWTTVDGVLIGRTNELTATAGKVGTYTLTILNNVLGCSSFSDVKVVLDPSAPIVKPFYQIEACSDLPGFAKFDLRSKDSEIKNGASNVSVLYYLNGTDADNRAAATLPDMYTNTISPIQTIFVRVENNDTNCYAITTLDLLVNPTPNPVVAEPLRVCDEDADGFEVFDLASFSETIINSDPEVVVSYHDTLNNAEDNLFSLPLMFSNITKDKQTIFARATNTRTKCYKTVSVDLIARPAPQVNDVVEDIELCDDDTDGFFTFDLTQRDKDISKDLNNNELVIEYFTLEVNAISGLKHIVDVKNFRNTVAKKQTIWARATNKFTDCFRYTKFDILANSLPVVVNIPPIELCDEGVDRKNGFTQFDLSIATTQIVNNQLGYQIHFYTDEATAKAGDASFVNPNKFINTTNPQVLYVSVSDLVTKCTSYTTVTLRVLPNPSPETPTPIEVCDTNTTGDGIEIFDLTEKQLAIENQEGGISLRYFSNQTDAEQGNVAGEIIAPTTYSNIKRDTETVYVRASNNASGCWSVVPLQVIVHEIPETKAFVDLNVCSIAGALAGDFDLVAHSKTILKNITKPADYKVTYHISQADADLSVQLLPDMYRSMGRNQTIWARVEHIQTKCYKTASFNLLVGDEVTVTKPKLPLVECGELANNTRQALFDLTKNASIILNGQVAADFTVSYYETFVNNVLSDLIDTPNAYTNKKYPQTIYVQVTRNVLPNCFAVTQFDLEINLKPEPELPTKDIVLCVDDKGTAITNEPLNSGLLNATHEFFWSLNGQEIVGATQAIHLATAPGTYNVIATNKGTGCSGTTSVTVVGSSKPVVSVNYLTADFAGAGSVLIESLDPTLYMYQLDKGDKTDNPLFQNISEGEHIVTVADKKGCGVTLVPIMITDYPQFFTPNGDGYNEGWKLMGLENNDKARVYIFDRHGQLLKEMKTSDDWNGTFNGNPLPSSDYWFTVQYEKQGQLYEFKSHFTLKR